MAEAAFDVVVCGSLHLDVMVDAPRLPHLDETLPGTGWGFACGGKGGNQAVASARLGARTAMIGRIGDDDFGRRLTAHLLQAGADASRVTTDAQAGSGMSVAIVDEAGDYGAVIVSGANLELSPDDSVESWHGLGSGRVLTLQNEIPAAANVAIASAARQSGATVIWNAAPARDRSDEMLGLADLIVVNRIEAEAMGAGEVRSVDRAVAAARRLADDRRVAIVTLGGHGLVIAEPDRTPAHIAASPVTVRSSHGAGDVFVGALSMQVAEGRTVVDAARFAGATAALHVSADPSTRTTPSAQEVEAFLSAGK